MTTVTIYHNPRCTTSRNTLALLRDEGIEPTIVEYLKAPPDKNQLTNLLQKLGLGPRAILRQKESLYTQLHLDDEALSDEAIVQAILEHPILMQRPIVVVDNKAKICRPSETVLELLRA